MTLEDRWLSVKDAAAAVSVSDATVRRYIRKGDVQLRLGLVRLSQVQRAEAAARRRKGANLQGGGARGKWLQEKAEAFFAAHGIDGPGRSLVLEFVAHARG
ncbi:MAG: hypothetical protein BGN97_03640 [Microbacterium sp. 69-10]|uniref:hypothetical protein n=1 Tax=Microbacterium sp. 69-10 TaxID=1895783 RepID=UPI00095A9696|nr:hypothetical protein [Microbacterium sp. 69-10]OJU41807.1 MAG: hypothetical protein BGN97_03640 [Microbacterium sp. 69-10]